LAQDELFKPICDYEIPPFTVHILYQLSIFSLLISHIKELS